MLGNFDGTAQEKLDQVAGVFADLAPQAMCRLNRDRTQVVCAALRPDGQVHVEKLEIYHLSAELVRHAAMRLGKATHLADSIAEWELWASAWHLIQTHGDLAIARVDERVSQLEQDGSAAGVDVFMDLRARVAVLQAEPKAWAGRA